MKSITITRALNELKLLDKRIRKAIHNNNFGAFIVDNKINLVGSSGDFSPKEAYQSINDLIKERRKIKNAIMRSNSWAEVKIGDEVMSVTEAIELKDSIKYLKELSYEIKNDINTTEETVANINYKVQSRLDSLLEANFGKDSKANSKDFEVISKPFLEKNEAVLHPDVEFSKKKLQELEDYIDTFESEVDLVLSESNSTTYIEV